MPKETRDVLDWSGDEVVAWTKPKWYEKLAVLSILIPMGVIFAIPPTPLRIGLSVATVVAWYFLLMFIIEDVKTWIITRRIKRAAMRRWHIKYAFQTLFEKYPWLETYLREVKKAEELGFPYVPDIVVKDPATAEIEIRRPPLTRWMIPQQIQYSSIQQAESLQPLEQPSLLPSQPGREEQATWSGEGEELSSDLRPVFEMIKQFVNELSVEETHALFRIMARLKGYGMLPKEHVAMQFVNLPLQTLTKYMERRRMPRTRKRVAGMKRRVILPTLKRDLQISTVILMDALERFAKDNPRHRGRVEEILRALTEPREEEQLENEEI